MENNLLFPQDLNPFWCPETPPQFASNCAPSIANCSCTCILHVNPIWQLRILYAKHIRSKKLRKLKLDQPMKKITESIKSAPRAIQKVEGVLISITPLVSMLLLWSSLGWKSNGNLASSHLCANRNVTWELEMILCVQNFRTNPFSEIHAHSTSRTSQPERNVDLLGTCEESIVERLNTERSSVLHCLRLGSSATLAGSPLPASRNPVAESLSTHVESNGRKPLRSVCVCIQVAPALSWNNWKPFPKHHCHFLTKLFKQPLFAFTIAVLFIFSFKNVLHTLWKHLLFSPLPVAKFSTFLKWCKSKRKGLKGGSNVGLLISIHVKQQSAKTGLSGESICAMSLALPKLLADSNSSAAASGLAALMSPDASL